MKKLLCRLMAFIAAIIVFASCSKSSDSPSNPTTGGSYPKTVNVEYRITKLSGNGLTTGSVSIQQPIGDSYTTETLPFSKKVTLPNIKLYDVISCSFSASVGGSIRIDILIEGKVVETKTFSGDNIISLSVPYIFQ